MTEAKAKLYKTAKARSSCACFKEGEFVEVRYLCTMNGKVWFEISRTEKGRTPYPIAYPENHLTDFCL
jgi:hypothetical protein